MLLLLVLVIWKIRSDDSCVCWDGYQVEKHDDGTQFCRGVNSRKLFHCNLETPPSCRCTIRNVVVELDVGTNSCFFAECENKEEWILYQMKNPEFHELEK
ncbi:hypothetical protein HHI36_000548 [Cryptolaemus montrouzieri]|uniref:Secreted protein n=1 Tax=Cryptolaemus montrouzieri TaxID=559131 RepID=A0ABD2P5C2_9CUCU